MLQGWVLGNLETMFTDVNTKVGEIAGEVGQTPSAWNGSIFSMIRNLSENVMIPIAGLIISAILCYELITMVMDKNNMHEVGSEFFFRYLVKACVAVMLLSKTFDITMAIFDVGNHIVTNAAGVISGSTSIDVTATLTTMFNNQLSTMGITLPKAEIQQLTQRPCSRSWPTRIPKTFILREKSKLPVNGTSTLCGCWLGRKLLITARSPVFALASLQMPVKLFFTRW